MAAPFLVHVVFHPDSVDARAFASSFRDALNGDNRLPGLRVPVVALAEDGTSWPPPRHDLDEAKRSAVIVLADDNMVVGDQAPAGRVGWPRFVADLARQCGSTAHRILPVQWSESAWPLHEDLSTINFIRAYAQSATERDGWLERRLVIELCRFLLGQDRGDKVPVRVFLSHAKQDINTPPDLFTAVATHLSNTQPVESWIDSAKIEPGKNFGDAILEGVRDSAVMVLATANYSTRPWCRREVLAAKKYGQPMIVVDGLHGVDARSFPYVGNVPVVAWNVDGPRHAVDVLLKEVLRVEHMKCVLKRQAPQSTCVLTSAPELLTLAMLPTSAPVLYPDPPLGDEEEEVLKSLGHRLETPLQRAGAARTLAGRTIALSISESDDIRRRGLFPANLDDALMEISRQLLVRGTALAYGGHLGSEGYTISLFDLVRAHLNVSTLPPAERIVNYTGWPVPWATVPVKQRAKYQNYVTYRRTPRPVDVGALDPAAFVDEPTYFPADSPARRYAWARGMSAMREQQSEETDARIVLGGKVGPTLTAQPDGSKKVDWYHSRMPGVIEEALLTLKAKRPLYVCGAFGGAGALIVDLLERRTREDFTWEYHRKAPHAEAMRELYKQQRVEWWDYPEMKSFVANIGVDGLSILNGLSAAENRELFACRDLPRLVELVLAGLANAVR